MRHSHSLMKLNYDIAENSSRVKIYYKNGWLSTDPTVLDLLKYGYDTFEENIVQRIMRETPEKVFFNNCSKCGGLARTPYARQCRCGHNWHHTVVAQFVLDEAFQITGRPFFLMGQILEGRVDTNNYLDLRRIGINKKLIINAVEIATKRRNGTIESYIALGLSDLTDTEKEFILKKDFWIEPLDILNER